MRYPERVDYAVVVSGQDGAEYRSDRYRARYDTDTGILRVQTISAREEAHPSVPHGFGLTLNISLWGVVILQTKDLTPTKAIEDLLGVPFLTPTYSFGLARSFAPALGPTPSPEGTGLKTIAVVSAAQHEYTVRLDGDETIDGATFEHLTLRPLRDPNRFRLRELWVDSATKLPRRAIVSRNFTVAPEDTVAWVVDFATIGGGVYIASENALSTLQEAHGRVVSNAGVTFDYAPIETNVPAIPLEPGPFRSLQEP
ncbi:MAG TPA: hypothetical protein VK760_12595 [Candidatus Acidoferrales bacterium]|nr:hypothetical protein [Candidatus Acidoferrales bacterium]